MMAVVFRETDRQLKYYVQDRPLRSRFSDIYINAVPERIFNALFPTVSQ